MDAPTTLWMLQRPCIAWARPRRKRNVDGEVPQRSWSA